MRALASVMLAGILSLQASGQSTDGTFEIADVHSSPRSTTSVMRSAVRIGRYEIRNATMLDLIRTAYGLDGDKILGGPAWLDYDRFDVIARIPAPPPPLDTLKSMLQTLLADRFKLTLHKDTRPVAGYVLSMGKGKPKLKEADGTGETGCKSQPQTLPPATPGVLNLPMTAVACHNMTMEAFAAALRGISQGSINNAVVDSTGLKGAWDFDLKWSSRIVFDLLGGADAVTLPDAVDKQLGLKLEEQKIPTPVIVVDQVNKKPTDNPPDLATKFPPPPPSEFEVADIKPSAPITSPGQFGQVGFLPGGRVNLPRFPLTLAISLAWNIPSDEIVGAPKWLNSTNFDIIAKAPVEAAPVTGGAPLQDLGPMLQALLVDRFKMKIHFEERPVTAYTLVQAKPKLKKADPAGRTGCKTSNAPRAPGIAIGQGAFRLPPSLVTCQNITMAQFADQLQILAGSYIHYPVVDGTGLEGAWDFNFTFSPISPAQLSGLRGAPPAGAGDAPGASDPVGGTSLFDAVEKQLGVKLEMQKRPYSVFVIDHIEEKPTDN